MNNLIKQPNGKYCSVSFNGKLDFFDYTEQDVINLYIEEAKKSMQNAEHYKMIIERIEQNDKHGKPRPITDTHLELMGFTKPFKELVKYIPRKPTNQSYASCDFATYGKCPNCGKGVQDGIGGKDEKCGSCGQILKW